MQNPKIFDLLEEVFNFALGEKVWVNFEEHEYLCKEVLSAHSNHTKARKSLAELYYWEKKFDQAVVHLEILAKEVTGITESDYSWVGSDLYSISRYYFFALYKMDQWKGVASFINELLEVNLENFDVFTLLGQTLLTTHPFLEERSGDRVDRIFVLIETILLGRSERKSEFRRLAESLM